MAAVAENPTPGLGFACAGRNIFRSQHRCLSPMSQLKISPHSSMNASVSNELPSPGEDPKDEISNEAHKLAKDYINYKTNQRTSKPRNEVSSTLRRVGDEMVDRHQVVVNAMSKRLKYSNPSMDDRYAECSLNERMFLMISDEIYKDGQENWGRIVTLYVLGGILALNNLDEKGGVDIEDIINFVGNYVGTKKRKWIEKNGGWDNFIKFFDNGASDEKKVWKGLLLSAVGLGAIATLAVGR